MADQTFTEPTPPRPRTVTARRADLIALAAELAEAGVPATVLHADLGDGIAQAVRRHERSGR